MKHFSPAHKRRLSLRAAATSNRERDCNYRAVVLTVGEWRIIECRDGIQWIIQKAKNTRAGRRWDGVSYRTTRKALKRVWTEKTADAMGAHKSAAHLFKRINGI